MTHPNPQADQPTTGAGEERISQAARDDIRMTAAKLAEYRAIPQGEFPGEKTIACANLEGWLGRYPLPLLDALEAAEDLAHRERERAEAAEKRLGAIHALAQSAVRREIGNRNLRNTLRKIETAALREEPS